MSVRAFERVAIVNRGEPAMRLINAVREWNAEGRRPLRTIAVYTAVDRHAMFVREADEAVLIGSADPEQAFGASPYLDHTELARALRECAADAVWPGWGFVSERSDFARMCRQLDITFVGPSPEVMERLGDKIAAKRLAAEVGVPLAAWSDGPVPDVAAARIHAERIGYPLMVKATAGGGGRGIRRVAEPAELAEAFTRAAEEGRKTAGDDTVFLERAIPAGRHVEVQVVADGTGEVWTLGIRDCSVQRRNQKVIEESASTALDAEQEELLRTSAAALAKAAGYVNAGTVEFLYEPKERLLSFLEVNTRLQVEHCVTEATTGADIVKLQLHIASGGRLADFGAQPAARGHAIEARLTAEDPEQGFAPAPGRIEHLVLPAGPGIRVDTGVATGDVIPPQFDSMIAKIIAWGRDRGEARARLVRALHQTAAVIDGGTTNKSFLLDLLDRPEVRSGEAVTTWLDTMMAEGYTPPRRLDVALLATAVEAQDAHVARQRERLFASAERGRPEVGHETWHQVDVRAGGHAYRMRVAQSRGDRYHVEISTAIGSAGGEPTAIDVDVERTGRFERKLTVNGHQFTVLSVPPRGADADGGAGQAAGQSTDYLVEVDGAVHRISGGEAGMVRAPAPAMVVAIPVAAGDVVEVGDVVAVVESMKLETALRAPVPGHVQEVLIAPNTQVEGGTKLIRIAPDSGAVTAEGDRVDLAALAAPRTRGTRPDPARAAADTMTSLRHLVLGFDIDERDARPLLDALAQAREKLAPNDARVLAGETAIFEIVADLCSLSRNRRGPEDETQQIDPGGEEARNPQEYLHAYLRSRDAEAEGLPESFRVKLRRALVHYGVSGLEPVTAAAALALDSALYRMFLAHRRATAHVPVVLSLLQWRLAHPDSLPDAAQERYQRVLDRLVTATQLRHPVVGGAARRVRYVCFEAPLIAAERADGQRAVRAELDRLATDPDERSAQIERIVAAAEPILGVFGERHHAAMLEVMTRRYYRVRQLIDVELADRGGRPLLTARYTHRGRQVVVLATTVHTAADAPPWGDPLAVQGDLRRIIAALPAGTAVALDLYVIAGEAPDADPERSADKIKALLGRLPDKLERVAVAVRRPGGDERSAWFTFVPSRSAGGTSASAADQRRPVEDRTLRGLHPMVAERLGLWRLDGFELTRLPAPIDVHLFRAVGRDVPDDTRLIALSDVRELTILRGADGRVRALPQLEHVLDSCMDALRSARTADTSGARLDWNRVLLYVWPVVDVPLAELDSVVRVLAPRTENLGLEQVLVQFRHAVDGAEPVEYLLRLSRPPGAGLTVRITEPPTEPMHQLDAYHQKVIRARRRGAVYPYELVSLLVRNPDRARDLAAADGTFTEYDLDETGAAVPVSRAPGGNTANLVLGVVTTPTARYPEGMTRVVLLGDPTKGLGSLAEAECARVCAAITLARALGAPVEWFAVSSGARIAMDSGTENMDWISRALRAIVEFTQDGGEINVVVTGINVGAQPYWNAEATMLMHTKGILVMTPDSAMVLTGKQALDYSGGVSAEDNFGIGGYDRIMGPNGQAQYWAPDLSGAMDVLLAHYAHTYRAPGERFPRPAPSNDPTDRDISTAPHAGAGTDYTQVGQVFRENPGRKKPFDIRSVMAAVVDADHPTLERWIDMIDAEGSVVIDAHLGGQPVCLIGIESRPLRRRGRLPVDGPTTFTAGTLFPRSSKKTARAINATSGNRPLVILANLSGFDGSPESLRSLQLEYGAEIGRAVVNFDGPIVFCVVSRYHGGAFVVFSGTLNDNLEIAAVEGSYASVLGGAPAAAVVFAGEVNKRTAADPQVADLEVRIADAQRAGNETEAAALTGELAAVRPGVRSQKLGEVADEFDAKHSIQRAQQVGSVDEIVAPEELRPYLVAAVRRGMARALERP